MIANSTVETNLFGIFRFLCDHPNSLNHAPSVCAK